MRLSAAHGDILAPLRMRDWDLEFPGEAPIRSLDGGWIHWIKRCHAVTEGLKAQLSRGAGISEVIESSSTS
jgi:hypothetical protein